MTSPGWSLTGSFDQGVSWFSRLLSAHVYPAPDSETWKPSRSFAITLIHGAGVQCPSSSTIEYSRPSSTKPPRSLSNSRRGRGGGGSRPSSGAGRRSRRSRRCGALGAADLLGERALAAGQHHPGRRRETVAVGRGQEIGAHDHDRSLLG